jgi:hypothetical protein
MLDKKRGYYKDRPFWAVDTNVSITAGMIAFLATNAAGVTVATTAASGTVPIGTFWKDSDTGFHRTTVESGTFTASDIIVLSSGNVRSTGSIKVTDSTGATVYTQGADYSVTLANGVVTRIGGGLIAASATVIVWYEYTLSANQVDWANASTRFSRGVNYDRQPNDTLGSSQITVVTGDSQLFTDQFDPAQTYTLNAALRSDTSSRWTTAVTAYPVCGRVIKVPTATDPFLGLDQIRVAQ